MAKFPVKEYAQLEMNRAGYLKNGLVVSQTPLSEEFTEAAPCENGMWVDADKANGVIKLPTEDTVQYGIVYTTEKHFGRMSDYRGLKQFYSVAGEYPRVGIMQRGDTFTTNCFDMGDYEDADALNEAIDAAVEAGKPLCLVPAAGDGRPVVADAAPADGFYATIIKHFTMPNGELAIKYVIAHE